MSTSRLDRVAFFCRWAFWGLLAAVSIALLRPEPIAVRDELVPEEGRFHAAKAFHIIGYAILTGLGTIGFPGRGITLGACLVAHGALVEIIQPHVGRNGTVIDVAFDAAGVALAFWLIRTLGSKPPAT
jgi:VanZ family protein